MFEDMKFTLCVSPDAGLNTALEWWREGEALGFDYIGIPDTPMLMREVWVSLTAAALNTSRAGIMLMVTNPITRDVSVTAGAMNALHDLAGDRVMYGIGAGDSASFAIGLGMAGPKRIGDYITGLRGLLAGETIEFNERKLKGAWRDFTPWKPLLMMAGSGPQTLRMAGRVADAAIMAGGITPEIVTAAKTWVAEGAREVGRDPAEIEIWHMCQADYGEDQVETFRHHTSLGSMLAHRGNPEGKFIPPEHVPALQEMAAQYSLEAHSRSNEAIVEIAQRTGALDYLMDRGGLLGPVDFTEKVQRYHDWGVRNLIFVVMGTDRMAQARRLSEKVVMRRAGTR